MDENKGGDKYGDVDNRKDGGSENSSYENFDNGDEQHIGRNHNEKLLKDKGIRVEAKISKHHIAEDGLGACISNILEQPAPDEERARTSTKLGSFGMSFGDLINREVGHQSESSENVTESLEHKHESDESIESDQINMCLSDTNLQDLKQKLTLRQKLRNMFRPRKKMTQKEFDGTIRILYKCCLMSVRDLHELHLRRVMAMEIIKDVIMRARSVNVSMANVIYITWSIMSCIHHFQLRLRTTSIGLVSYSRRKKADECSKYYSQLIRLFRPEMHRIILNAVITFYREGKLWEIEFACTDMIVQILQIYQDAEEGLEDLLYTLETSTLINVHEAKCLTQILYEILKKVRWKRMSEYLMKKILSMLESSIVPKSTDIYNYFPLRKGLEICMRNTISNLGAKDLMKLIFFILKKLLDKDLNDDTIMCFGNLATYGAKKFRMNSQQNSIVEGPLLHIFQLFKIDKHILILFATRMWQSLIDRNNNGMNFLSPRIELENMYQAVALTLIEIPCGYTASCFITVAMSLQEHAFSITEDRLVESHHLHATVLSLLTLICYIHNATVFYDYVNTIMERRAEWAPHLNPPLKSHYEYAQHHVLWNKPELFFEDWEARYGLWKCFRTKRKNVSHESIIF